MTPSGVRLKRKDSKSSDHMDSHHTPSLSLPGLSGQPRPKHRPLSMTWITRPSRVMIMGGWKSVNQI